MAASTSRLLACAGSAVVLLAFATPARADVAAPRAKQLVCKGQKQGDKDVASFRAQAEKDALFGYAVKTFGTPKSCRVETQDFDGQSFPSVTYDFNGATLHVESMPPEVSRTELDAPGGFPDEKAAIAVVKSSADTAGYGVDWKAKPEVDHDAKAGTDRKTYWDPTEGANAGVDLVYKGKKLVGIGLHSAP